MDTKKFIAPGGWFEMTYPASWSEFEDSEECFLFYNPDSWTGNFRISAYKGENERYGRECVADELKQNPSAKKGVIGGHSTAASLEMYEENGVYYTTHFWVVDFGVMVIEASFTTEKGADIAEAEAVIASIKARRDGEKYPSEIIPVRVSEIYQIDNAYEWVEHQVKELLKCDFNGHEDDIDNMQQMMVKSNIGPKKREFWMNLGITLCVIYTNEVDGVEWRTLIDGNREAPVLLNVSTGQWTDPMKVVWSKVKSGGTVNLIDAYQEIMEANISK